MVDVSVVIPQALGADSIEEGLELAAAAGADGVELYDLAGHSPSELRAMAADHDLAFAATLAHGETPGIDNVSPAIADPTCIDQSISDLGASIETAAELGANGLVVTVGQRQDRFAPHEQYGAIVEVLRAVAPRAEEAGVTLLPEMLNRRVDHPGYLLESSSDGYRLVTAVDSPAVKVLFDVYHQQISEGYIIQNLRDNADLIGHFHIADVPGRREPGTGELDYDAIFATIADIDYDGYVGCEFWADGERYDAVENTIERIKSV